MFAESCKVTFEKFAVKDNMKFPIPANIWFYYVYRCLFNTETRNFMQ